MKDFPRLLFATIGYTEKPDAAAAKIFEGRVDPCRREPFVLPVPLFIENFQSSEDYYFRPYFATLLRLVRFIAYFTTLFAPALYVAITTFHHELIPTSLLFTMAAAREGIPFPAFVESLIMIVTFEILREAGVRLPRSVGQALSIVGALVVGEAAVSAGFIGAPMVIVVAITAVSGFVVPNLTDSAAVLRFVYLVLGAMLGGFGITLGFLGTLVHTTALESFGYPFLSPIAPFDPAGTTDVVVRAPLRFMIRRPKGLAADRQRRKGTVFRGDDGKASADYEKDMVQLLAVFVMLTCCAGCYDRRELDTLGIVIAQRLTEGKRRRVEAHAAACECDGRPIVQIVGGTSKSGSAGSVSFTNIPNSGRNINYIVRDFEHKVSRKIYTAHNQVIVLGEELAKLGVRDSLDFFVRAPEARMTPYVVVARERRLV